MLYQMKKFFAAVLLLFSATLFVACSSNPAIEAAKDFLAHPRVENLLRIEKLEGSLTQEEIEEYEEWCSEHQEDVAEAVGKISN